MSAAEKNDKKKLSPEEFQKVRSSLEGQMELKDAAVPTPQPKCADPETFDRVSKWALQEHRELLSRLAK